MPDDTHDTSVSTKPLNMGFEWLSVDEAGELEERLLGNLSTITHAQSAALWLFDETRHLYVSSYRGLFDITAYESRWPVDESLSAQLQAGVPWVTGEAPVVQAWVPLVLQNDVVGVVQLGDPLFGEFRDEGLTKAQALNAFAAVALKNARKFKTLQRQGLRDRETGAYHLSYFTDYASKEIYKARRYGRTFTLVSFSIENLSQIRLRLGDEAAGAATRGVSRALSKIIRDPDVLARCDDKTFFLLMPETDFFGSAMFLRRAAVAIRMDAELRGVEERLPLGLLGGAATYPKDGEDFDELVECCQKRLAARRTSLQVKLQLEPLPFWDEVELLVGTRQSPPLPVDANSLPSLRAPVSQMAFETLQMELAREFDRDPHSRGLLYVSCPEIHSDLPILKGLSESQKEWATRVYVLGPRGKVEFHPMATVVSIENDERSRRHPFVLWLSENASLAFIGAEDEEGFWAFQSADAALVEGLIAKLQSEYDLQPY